MCRKNRICGIMVETATGRGVRRLEPISFFPLLLITALAFAVPILTSSFRKLLIPSMVGEILCGMVVGKSGLNLIQEGPWLAFLSHFGFAYLMFLSGLELDLDLLRPRRSLGPARRLSALADEPLGLSLTAFCLRLVLAYVVSRGLAAWGLVREAWLMTLILSTTSVGVVLLILKEEAYLERDYGQVVLACAVVADLVTVILLTAGFLYTVQGWNPKLLLFLLLFAAVAAVGRLHRWIQEWAPVRRVLVELAHATSQIRVRGVLALLLSFVVLSQALGAEIILGAFLAGAVVAGMARGEIPNLQLKLDAMGYGFFVPIFFIMVGVKFDLPALLASGKGYVLVPVLVLMAYGVNLVSSVVLRRRFSWKETVAAGVLLSARLSLIVAAAAIALEIGAIGPAVNSAIVLMALVTCVVSPLGFNYLMRREHRPTRYVQIIGAGSVGVSLARRLREQGLDVILLDKDRETCRRARALGLTVLAGDARDPDFLAMTGIFADDILVLTLKEDRANLEIARAARDLFHVDRIIARCNDPARAREYAALEARVVAFERQGILAMENLILRPNLVDFLSPEAGDREIQEVEVGAGGPAGRALSEVRLPGDALVLYVRRRDEILLPHGRTRLYPGDVLGICGDPEAVQAARRLLGPPGPERA